MKKYFIENNIKIMSLDDIEKPETLNFLNNNEPAMCTRSKSLKIPISRQHLRAKSAFF